MKPTSSTATPAITEDAPSLTQADFDRGQYRLEGRAASRAEWQAAVRARTGKLRVTLLLDAPIVDHFKAMSGSRGYQALINDTLRRVIESGHLEADLRRIIREELAARD
jgi:uncharacterized protein (DUF4415 family)